MNRKILILGLSDTAITTIRCFKTLNVEIFGMDYNTNLSGFSSRLIKSIKTPSPQENEKEWLYFIIKWLKKKNDPFILIPTSDEYVYFITKYNDEFKNYCTYIIPEYNQINNILDRYKQFQFAQNLGLYIPQIYEKFEVYNTNVNFPIIIKPRNIIKWKKIFSKKLFLINNLNEFNLVIKELEEKNIDYIIQEVIQGDNINNFEVNSLYLPNGKIFQHVIRKIRQLPDQFGTATCIENYSSQILEKLATDYITKLNLYGFTNIEFKFNIIDNKYYYIETNPRVWLQINFSAASGINFPLIYYNYLNNKIIPEKINIRRNGKWVDFLPDILFWLKFHRKYKIKLFDFIKSWFPIISTNLLSLNDPIPFLKELKISKRLINLISKK